MQLETPIEKLMDEMHDALLTADFKRLGVLSPELEAALADFAKTSDSDLLARLKHKSDRNAICALAAGRGVRAAIRRLAEVRQNVSGLVTYDEKGNRAKHNKASEVSRRL